MTLLFFDGLDSYNGFGDYINLRGGRNSGTFDEANKTVGRFGGMAYKGGFYGGGIFGSGGSILIPSNPSDLWTGRASLSTGDFVTPVAINFSSAIGVEGSITIDGTSGIVRAVRPNGAILGQSAFHVFSQYVWHWIDVHFKLDDNYGIIEVYIDNKQVLDVRNVDTKYNSGATGISSINLQSGGQNTWDDDIYILDTSGPAPWNTRLGDCRMVCLRVNSDIAPNNGVPSNGSAQHYTNVNSMPIGYSTNNYITLQNVSGQKEQFGVGALPSTPANILAVSVISACIKSDAGAATFRNTITVNNTEYSGISKSTLTNWQLYRDDFAQNPDTTSQWQPSDLVNLPIGIKVE